jgi:hypothetical protein
MADSVSVPQLTANLTIATRRYHAADDRTIRRHEFVGGAKHCDIGIVLHEVVLDLKAVGHTFIISIHSSDELSSRVLQPQRQAEVEVTNLRGEKPDAVVMAVPSLQGPRDGRSVFTVDHQHQFKVL